MPKPSTGADGREGPLTSAFDSSALLIVSQRFAFARGTNAGQPNPRGARRLRIRLFRGLEPMTRGSRRSLGLYVAAHGNDLLRSSRPGIACKRAGGFDSRPPPLPGLLASSCPRSEESHGLHRTEKPVKVGRRRERPRGTSPDLAAVLCSSGPIRSYAGPRLPVKGTHPNAGTKVVTRTLTQLLAWANEAHGRGRTSTIPRRVRSPRPLPRSVRVTATTSASHIAPSAQPPSTSDSQWPPR
jgi:hypothetical protein